MKVRYTVPSDASRISYVGNGSTTVFSVPFVFFDDTDLQVISVNDTTAVETTKVLTTDYTVSGGGGGAGSVTMLVAPATGTTLVIQREVPYTQEIDYQANDGFPADVNEEGLDRNTMQVQQVRRRARQSPKLPATYDPESGDITLPMPVAGKTLVANEDEDGWENADVFSGSEDLPVLIVGVADRDVLEYDLGSTSWKNRTLATVLGRMLTTQGDLLRRGVAGVERLAIGAANRFLKSNGTTESWGQVDLASADITGVLPRANGGFVAQPSFLAKVDGVTTIGALAKMPLSNAVINSGAYWNNSTQRFIPPAGIYSFRLNLSLAVSNSSGALYLYKNGVAVAEAAQGNSQTWIINLSISTLDHANGTDYYEAYWQSPGATATPTAAQAWFGAYGVSQD